MSKSVEELKKRFEKSENSIEYKVIDRVYDITEDISKMLLCKNWSREYLAMLTKISNKRIKEIMRGDKKTTIEEIVKIFHALGFDYRFDWTVRKRKDK